jgi:hypothetical protein
MDRATFSSPSFFFLCSSAYENKCALIFLASWPFCAGGSVGNHQTGSDEPRADDVQARTRKTLGEAKLPRFPDKSGNQARTHHKPRKPGLEDLKDYRKERISLAFELAPPFHFGALKSKKKTKMKPDTPEAITPVHRGNHIETGITRAWPVKEIQGTRKRSKQGGEEIAQPIGSLESGFRNGRRALDIHEYQHKYCAAPSPIGTFVLVLILNIFISYLENIISSVSSAFTAGPFNYFDPAGKNAHGSTMDSEKVK